MIDSSIFNTQVHYFQEKVTKDIVEWVEEDKLTIYPGQCFGDWGLIYKTERSSSAYCLEDTDVFMLDAHCFDLSFSVNKLFYTSYI